MNERRLREEIDLIKAENEKLKADLERNLRGNLKKIENLKGIEAEIEIVIKEAGEYLTGVVTRILSIIFGKD